MERAQRSGWRVYYLGGTEEVLTEGLARLRGEFPELAIDGHNGYFDPRPGSAANAAVVDHINRFEPHILIVGMGMGRRAGARATRAGPPRAGPWPERRRHRLRQRDRWDRWYRRRCRDLRCCSGTGHRTRSRAS